MLVSLDAVQTSLGEPFFDIFHVVVVALRCREDIESIVQLHIEGEVGIIREGKLFGDRTKA